MKRILALLGACLYLWLLAGCSLLADIELAEPEPEAADGEPEEPEEPEGPKALTVMFAHEIDDGRAALLEGAQQIAEEMGCTLSSVVTLGDPELQSRFLKLASEAGEQAVLLELADPAAASAAIEDAGEMAVGFIDVLPDSGLSKRAVYVGNPEGRGTLYLRMTGRTAMRAAGNLIQGVPAGSETGLRLSGHKITIPADGVMGGTDAGTTEGTDATEGTNTTEGTNP